jgi:hypothetical protein
MPHIAAQAAKEAKSCDSLIAHITGHILASPSELSHSAFKAPVVLLVR